MQKPESGSSPARLEYWTKITGPVFGAPFEVPIVRYWGSQTATMDTMRNCVNETFSDVVSLCLESVVDACPTLPVDSIVATQKKLTIEMGLNVTFCSFRGTFYMVEFAAFANNNLI